MVTYFGFCIWPEILKSIIQCFWQGSYEIPAWEIPFWGYLCVSVRVYERENKRERRTTQVLWGRKAIGFIRLPKGPYFENTLIRPPYISGLLLICTGYLKFLTSPRVPRSVFSFPQIPTTSFSPDKPALLHCLPQV